MSALKENPNLVREIINADGTSKLKFPKVVPNEHLRRVAREPLLTGDKLEAYKQRMGDTPERKHMVTGKAALRLPNDHRTKQPFIDPTPRDWRRVTLARDGDSYRLLWGRTNSKFLPGERAVLRFPEDLATEGLSLEQATVNGRKIETLLARHEGAPRKEK